MTSVSSWILAYMSLLVNKSTSKAGTFLGGISGSFWIHDGLNSHVVCNGNDDYPILSTLHWSYLGDFF